MAARRISKSAVDWAKFMELVPENQKDLFRAFKARSDMFVSRVNRLPAELPAIDFAMYRSRLPNAKFVDEYAKAYGAMQVAYPKDVSNVKAAIEADERAADESTAKFVAEANVVLDKAKHSLSVIDSVPNLESMTQEMFTDYFPDQALNPEKKPSFWPHVRSQQTGQDPLECKA